MKSSDAVPGVKFASSVEQVVGKNLITADGDILRMFKIEGTCGGQRQGRQRQGANQARGLIGKAVKKWTLSFVGIRQWLGFECPAGGRGPE